MPIRNLSDRTGALPTIGELRKGEPKPERGIGRDLNESFRFTSDAPLVEAAFVKAYGERPTSVPCLLPGNTTDEVFDAWQEEYNASTLLHRCDGQNVVNQLQPDGTRRLYPLGEGPPCPYLNVTGRDRRDGCKPTGRLKIIPVVQDQHSGTMRVADLRRIGQVLVLTTSKHDIKNVAECLHWYERIHGTLAGIPFVLSRTPVEISTPRGDGQRARTKKWLIDLTPSPEWVTLKLESQRQRAFAAVPGAIAALPAASEAEAVALVPRQLAPIEDDQPDEDLDEGAEPVEPEDEPRRIDTATGEITEDPPIGRVAEAEQATREALARAQAVEVPASRQGPAPDPNTAEGIQEMFEQPAPDRERTDPLWKQYQAIRSAATAAGVQAVEMRHNATDSVLKDEIAKLQRSMRAKVGVAR